MFPFKQNKHSADRNTRGKESLTFFQFFLKLFNFFLELAEHSILGILINPGLVLYVLGSVCISESADGLIIVVVCWSNVCTLQHVDDSVGAQHKACRNPTPPLTVSHCYSHPSFPAASTLMPLLTTQAQVLFDLMHVCTHVLCLEPHPYRGKGKR